MKKILLPLLIASAFTTGTKAQSVIDTVSIGAGYANQTWYSLQNDNQGSAPKNNWDLAFDVSNFGSSIHINSITGTMLWKYPVADTAGWVTLDTTGLSTWPALYNSDTSWIAGAFDKGMVLSNPYDLGWGVYSPTTHIVTGDSVYVIKLASGVYKKLWIENLAGSAYSFRYSDLNNTNLQTVSLSKPTYSGKNFGYYSIQTNTALDREPVSANWDLVFTQYTTFIPTAYTVSGILHNKGVKVAQVKPIANPTTYTNWSAHTFNTEINEIGYDWKVFTGSFVIEDSLVYFVQTNAGDIWKVIPTGFGGGSTGNYMFSKEKLSSTGLNDETGNLTALLSVYPNPSTNGNTTIVYDFENQVSSAVLNVYDLSGKNIYSEKLTAGTGLHTYNLNTSTLTAGMYFITIDFDGKKIQQKLIIQ
ncbi:MAG: T9SS type A sorting domain-containing protein [Bacteroidia bacterium]|nr:T9SS type A sorting domain-containing protein [Bacteroidia bacterium]